MKSLLVSVIIPTFNRANMLAITLDSFIKQNYPKDCYEIIVVNNNSTDNTQDIIDEYENKYPGLITGLFESRQGVHYARNSAALVAQGDLLYYTDDDMIAYPDLISNLVKVFIDNRDVASASGKIIPKWEVEPPIWVKENLMNGWLSLNDLGDDTIITEEDIGVYSCHQMIRKNIFLDVGGFNPENTAGEWLGDGETGLNIKIKNLGYKFAYVGNSVIEHMIPPSRMTQNYLNNRLANQGNCDSYTYYRTEKPSLHKLLLNSLMSLHKSSEYWIYALLRFHRKSKEFKIRRAEAYAHYYFSRFKYDLRLFVSKKWRALVMRQDWLNQSIKYITNIINSNPLYVWEACYDA